MKLAHCHLHKGSRRQRHTHRATGPALVCFLGPSCPLAPDHLGFCWIAVARDRLKSGLEVTLAADARNADAATPGRSITTHNRSASCSNFAAAKTDLDRNSTHEGRTRAACGTVMKKKQRRSQPFPFCPLSTAWQAPNTKEKDRRRKKKGNNGPGRTLTSTPLRLQPVIRKPRHTHRATGPLSSCLISHLNLCCYFHLHTVFLSPGFC